MSDKLSIRPVLDPVLLSGDLSDIERFQNTTLRPILKLQHDLILSTVKYYNRKKKNIFSELDPLKQETYIADHIIGDKNISQELNGIVLGMMDIEEYTFYTLHASELKRRIKTMTLERILSAMDGLRK